jgi:hypothetical protein
MIEATREDDLKSYADSANALWANDDESVEAKEPPMQLAAGISIQTQAVKKGLERDGYLDSQAKPESTSSSPTYKTGKSDRQIYEETNKTRLDEERAKATAEGLMKKRQPTWTAERRLAEARRMYGLPP